MFIIICFMNFKVCFNLIRLLETKFVIVSYQMCIRDRHISANQIFFNHGPWFDRLVVSPVFRKSKVACGANFWGELNWPKVNILVAIEKYISQSYRFDPRNSLSFYTRKFARLFDWFSLLLGCSSPYTGKGNKFVSVGLSLSLIHI